MWFFEATSGRLRYKLQDGAALGVEMDPDAWLVTFAGGEAAAEISGGSEGELLSRTSGKAMNRAEYIRIKKAFESKPGYWMVDDHNAVLELKRLEVNPGDKVEGATYNHNFILLRPGASRSALFEELIHSAQLRRGMNPATEVTRMEIEAKQKLIRFQRRYKISDAENKETIEQLSSLLKQKTN